MESMKIKKKNQINIHAKKRINDMCNTVKLFTI